MSQSIKKTEDQPIYKKNSKNQLTYSQQIYRGQNNKRKIEKNLEQLCRRIWLLKIKNLGQCFREIKKYTKTLQNKQLIYAAINRKNNPEKNQQSTARKLRKQTKISTFKKQIEESFIFDHDGISTIKNNSFEVNSITYQSRIELDFFPQSRKDNQNKFIDAKQVHLTQKKQKRFQNQEFTNKKISKNNPQMHNDSNYRNLQFQVPYKFYSKLHGKSQNSNLNETILFETKLKKKTKNQIIQQIFIFKETSRKKKRPSSMSLKQKDKYIQIPLKSNNFKVFQCLGNTKKNVRSFKSLQTKTSTKNCLQHCSNNSTIEKCKYCSMIQRSSETIRQIQHFN